MSCCDDLKIICSNRKTILIGEIGALLHDIGKAHPSFINDLSVDGVKSGQPHYHAWGIDDILSSRLLEYLKNDRLKVKLGKADEKSVYDFIREHHPERDKEVKSVLLEYLMSCDRKDSADDKGIVRRKQSIKNTVISSPFGSPKEVINLDSLQKRFDELDNQLGDMVERYINHGMDLIELRNAIRDFLKSAFSHALGETRIPANDVTLWDHSFSTASLFKSTIAGKVLGEEPKGTCRFFGINWNGWEFIKRGRKIADIQKRSEIIEEIKSELRKKFEDDFPIGNALYEDINGIYFSFPGLDLSEAKKLAEECAQKVLEEKIIDKKSDHELWPFFTLSRASGSLTIIAEELKFAAQKRKVPRMTPVLFVEGSEEHFFNNSQLEPSEAGQGICPTCRLRPKDEEGERVECSVCWKRRRGRLGGWLDGRKDTIWIEEAADKNNRIALLSFDFNLEKWLDGTLIRTVCSQTFEDWLSKEEKNALRALVGLKKILSEQITDVNEALESMKKAKDPSKVKDRIEEKMKDRATLEQRKRELEFDLEPNWKTAYKILDAFFKGKDSKKTEEKNRAVDLLRSFFEEKFINKDNFEQHLKNIKQRAGVDELTKETLATQLFTQNPSPARLYRIWREAEEFFNLVGEEIKKRFYADCWKRIRFSVDPAAAKKYNLGENTPYVIRIEDLEPDTLLVLHTEKGNCYTIESLDKFKYDSMAGKEAVKEALGKGIHYLALEDEPQNNLLNNEILYVSEETDIEKYYPFIEINKSPLSLSLIVPACDSMKIAEFVINLYGKQFKNVVGKLPLSIKLLVTNRKIPLYVLLDAESRMLEGEEFKKQKLMNPWWDINETSVDAHYSFYPKKIKDKYALDDIAPISRGRVFALFPGYFDFELLLGTTDRYSIAYKKDGKRADEDYRLFTGRPYYSYQIAELRELWELLSQNLSSSQIHFVEDMLTLKLREWRKVRRGNKVSLLKNFAEATLRDAFSEKWECLREESKNFLICSSVNGMLLDAVNLFGHVIKEKGVD